MIQLKHVGLALNWKSEMSVMRLGKHGRLGRKLILVTREMQICTPQF
jgi:hypothetical protein